MIYRFTFDVTRVRQHKPYKQDKFTFLFCNSSLSDWLNLVMNIRKRGYFLYMVPINTLLLVSNFSFGNNHSFYQRLN